MGSLGDPKDWVPYMNSKDCTQGFCSIYCPQWCYQIFPPPPPFRFPDESSSSNFSPLVIAIIGILASAFLLVSYYTIISKYCGGNADSSRRENGDQEAEPEDNRDLSLHEQWHVATAGLDEALIKSITVVKYKKGDGLVEGTDCSVCLSEFEEDERLRLLPKCSHAFHLQCIDTWLKSHSNCPLCRANIVFITPAQPQLLPQFIETPPSIAQDVEMRSSRVPRTSLDAISDLRNFSEGAIGDTVLDIRSDEEYQHMRRSVSMNYLCQSRVSVADILCICESEEEDDDDDVQVEAGSSKQSSEELNKCSNRNRVAMKRSFSSGRFFVTAHGCRGKAISNILV